MIKVRFLDFWKTFDPIDSVFYKILKSREKEIIFCQNSLEFVDLEFQSVFINRSQLLKRKLSNFLHPSPNIDPALRFVSKDGAYRPKGSASRRVWYSGENIRPPYSNEIDSFLSFDQDRFGGKNTYMPLWWHRLNWYESHNFSQDVGVPVTVEILTQPREVESQKKGFACAFIGNSHPTRLRFIEQLRKFGEVDVFGNSVGRPVHNKYSIAKDYKFSVCFENDL